MSDNFNAKAGDGTTIIISAHDEGGGVLSSRVTPRVAGADVSSGNPMPVVSASLPLPSNAAQETGGNLATIATNTAQGTKTSASTMPTGGVGLFGWLSAIYFQLTQSLTVGGSISVSNFPGTQPVSGTVTANAGTNLNTSLLALETGGNLATIATNTGHIPAAGLNTAANSIPVCLPEDAIQGKMSWIPITLSSSAGTVTTVTIPDNAQGVRLYPISYPLTFAIGSDTPSTPSAQTGTTISSSAFVNNGGRARNDQWETRILAPGTSRTVKLVSTVASATLELEVF